jgi:CheY-like chemotaxis protein
MTARILVIEDNEANLALMTYLLQAHGYEPAVARDGAEGLEAAAHERPDLIVCDVQMPHVDGYEVVKRIKRGETGCTAPVVAVTAFAMVGDRDKLLAAGFDGYIAKPIAPESFVKTIEQFLQPGKRADSANLAAAAAAAAAVPTRAAARVPSKGTVLVVDNTPSNNDFVASVLEPHGYCTVRASSVEKARATMRETRLDLVISDLRMPDRDGFDLLRMLRAEPAWQALPVIILTSSQWVGADRALALDLGAAGFLVRPIAPEALLAEVEKLLPRKELAHGGSGDA